LQKEELIKHLKSFLPSGYSFSVKNINNYLVYIRKKIFSTEVFIHPVFLKADKNNLSDIIGFITNNDKTELKNIKKRLSDFFNKNHEAKKTKINITFKNKNINTMFLNVLTELKLKFKGVDFSKVKITWGRFAKKRSHSIRFGSFDRKHNLVRLHPILDNSAVPDFFIYSVLYHEIAHFIIFSDNDKAKSHGANFNKLLKSIDPFFIQSKKWEKENKKLFFGNLSGF